MISNLSRCKNTTINNILMYRPFIEHSVICDFTQSKKSYCDNPKNLIVDIIHCAIKFIHGVPKKRKAMGEGKQCQQLNGRRQQNFSPQWRNKNSRYMGTRCTLRSRKKKEIPPHYEPQ